LIAEGAIFHDNSKYIGSFSLILLGVRVIVGYGRVRTVLKQLNPLISFITLISHMGTSCLE
jgi:uncharacterized membrane protein